MTRRGGEQEGEGHAAEGEPLSKRLPVGYRGVGHETIGSDIQALTEAVLMPELVLGKELFDALSAVKPNGWYPVDILLKPLERLDSMLGPASLRQVGLKLFKLSHERAFLAQAKTARDIVYGIDVMYHRANRGVDIGGWKVLELEPGRAVLEKTTPHHCVMEEGILEGAFRALGIQASIYQSRCFRKGNDRCEFRISSHVTDARWSPAGR